jgi:hypothetical protein
MPSLLNAFLHLPGLRYVAIACSHFAAEAATAHRWWGRPLRRSSTQSRLPQSLVPTVATHFMLSRRHWGRRPPPPHLPLARLHCPYATHRGCHRGTPPTTLEVRRSRPRCSARHCQLRCRCCLESYTSVSSPLRHRPRTPGGHHPCLPARRRCACPVASADLHLPIKNALCCWRRWLMTSWHRYCSCEAHMHLPIKNALCCWGQS